MKLLVASVGLAVAALACAGAGSREAPLAGRIWDVRGERFVGEGELVAVLAQKRYVLLGEIHDNPLHHRLQAQVLRRLAATGRRPSVVLEMIPRDRADALRDALADPGPGGARIREAVAWDASGWPDWRLYEPIFEAALEAHLALVAGDLHRNDRKALRRAGLAGLDPDRVRALGLDAEVPPALRAGLEASIREGHCDLLPDAAIPPMIAFQRARDAQLARSLAEAAAPDGAVLIAGAGHVRRDIGVPVDLARFDPGATVAGIGFVEVDPTATDPRRELADGFRGGAPFDYVWFTPRAPREDPCEALERELAPDGAPAADDSGRWRVGGPGRGRTLHATRGISSGSGGRMLGLPRS